MNEMVTITREEYDRLREAAEDLADLQAYDRAMAEGGESFPSEIVNRLLNGDNPISVFRMYRGYSGAELARRADINRVQLHDIEHGRKQGSVATLRKIADALGVDLDDLA